MKDLLTATQAAVVLVVFYLWCTDSMPYHNTLGTVIATFIVIGVLDKIKDS